jgi:hypothetical protein
MIPVDYLWRLECAKLLPSWRFHSGHPTMEAALAAKAHFESLQPDYWWRVEPPKEIK